MKTYHGTMAGHLADVYISWHVQRTEQAPRHEGNRREEPLLNGRGVNCGRKSSLVSRYNFEAILIATGGCDRGYEGKLHICRGKAILAMGIGNTVVVHEY